MTRDNVQELTDTGFHSTFGRTMRPADARWPPSVFMDHVVRAINARRGVPAPRAPELTNTYVSDDDRHAHLLYGYGIPNVYLVVVLSLPEERVVGYHRLDLNQKYGLPPPADPTWFPSAQEP